MNELYRWMFSISRKSLAHPSRPPFPPTFLDVPQDVFLNICEWLSVRDVLALRMVCRVHLLFFDQPR